jgi:hypothetical protein
MARTRVFWGVGRFLQHFACPLSLVGCVSRPCHSDLRSPISVSRSPIPTSVSRSPIPISDPDLRLPISDPDLRLPISDPDLRLPISDPDLRLPISDLRLPISDPDLCLPISDLRPPSPALRSRSPTSTPSSSMSGLTLHHRRCSPLPLWSRTLQSPSVPVTRHSLNDTEHHGTINVTPNP